MSREDFNPWYRDGVKRSVSLRTLLKKTRPAPEPRVCPSCGKTHERLDSTAARCVSCELPPRRRA